MKLLRYLYLAYLSQPKGDRLLYRLVRKRKLQRFVEIGVGAGLRAQRLIELAKQSQPEAQVRYTGIDLFEARPQTGPAGMALKDAYRVLKATGVQPQLMPGDAFSALARVANGLAGTDMVLISADQDPASVARAWFYLPRILTPTSLVMCEEADPQTGGVLWRQLSASEIEQLTGKGERRRAA